MMCDHVLVAYGTRFASTADVAEAIGMCLEQVGVFADVRSVDEVQGFYQYQAVILGSTSSDGKSLPQMVEFLEKHREALSRIPVAYFTISLTLHDDEPPDRRMIRYYHFSLLQNFPEVRPVSIGMFPAAVDYPDSSQAESQAAPCPEGDCRDWSAIRDWALSVTPLLIGQLQPL